MKRRRKQGENRKPRSRAEARALGVVRYHTGKPCKNGHIAERRVTNGSCVVCMRKWKREWRTNKKRGDDAGRR